MLLLVLIPTIVVALLAALWLVGERGHLALPSTGAALRDRRATEGPGGGLLQALHGYIYGRWPEGYINLFRRVAPWMGPRARQIWADHYHGKVLPTELACRIIRLDHPIKRDLDQIIPYRRARTIVLSASPQVTLLECPCRLGKPEHCQPTQVCMLVGGGDFTLEHHPTKARRVTQGEGSRSCPDVVSALAEAKQKAGSDSPSMPVVAFPEMIQDLLDFIPFLNLRLTSYTLASEEDAPPLVAKAITAGAQVVIGGAITTKIARERGLPAVLLRSGEASIRLALEEAQRIVYARRLDATGPTS